MRQEQRLIDGREGFVLNLEIFLEKGGGGTPNL